MKTYHFHYWLKGVTAASFLFSFFIYRSGETVIAVILAILGIILLFYNLAYIELTDEALTVRWRPYRKLVLRKVLLRDIISITSMRKGILTSYFLNLDPDSPSATNWPAIGWPSAYQVGMETKNAAGMVADIFHRIPDVKIDEETRAMIQRHGISQR